MNKPRKETDAEQDEQLSVLLNMGFEPTKAKQALRQMNGNMDKAIGYLTSENGGKNHKADDSAERNKPCHEHKARDDSNEAMTETDPETVPWSNPNERNHSDSPPPNPNSPGQLTSLNHVAQTSGHGDPSDTPRGAQEGAQVQTPGAVYVSGPDGNTRNFNADEYTITGVQEGEAHPEEHMHPYETEAELVQDDAPDREILYNRIQQLEDRLEADRNREIVPGELVVPNASPEDETEPKQNGSEHKRARLIYASVGLCLLAVAVALCLVFLLPDGDQNGDELLPTPPPTSTTTTLPPSTTTSTTPPSSSTTTSPTPPATTTTTTPIPPTTTSTTSTTTTTPTPPTSTTSTSTTTTTPAPPTTTTTTPIPPPEDQIFFNTDNLEVQLIDGTRWTVVDGTHWLMVFETEDEAEFAIQVIQFYGMNTVNFVGRPDPGYEFFLVDGHAPVGSFAGEDCLPMDRSQMEIVFDSSFGLHIIQSSSRHFSFPTLEEAEEALEYIFRYEFDYSCFVGRPDPGMSYSRR